MSGKRHWDEVYAAKGPEHVSWFRPHLDRSLAFLDAARIGPDAGVIDVGGGASTFVDDLLDRGYRNVTVLDLSQAALDAAQWRLGERARDVRWICADATEARLPENAYDFWHDRAVFHFLLDAGTRARYVDAVRRSLRPGGHIVVATFGPHGPEKCSGLDVLRFTPEALHAEFGTEFSKLADTTEAHVTPWGSEQEFVYCYCRLPKPAN
ncbi:MAG TPA: class I SAM-dependent methyltransferase [Thermoanaerobaculia bacterium]|jgi:SAM-dependent methyltransferase